MTKPQIIISCSQMICIFKNQHMAPQLSWPSDKFLPTAHRVCQFHILSLAQKQHYRADVIKCYTSESSRTQIVIIRHEIWMIQLWGRLKLVFCLTLICLKHFLYHQQPIYFSTQFSPKYATSYYVSGSAEHQGQTLTHRLTACLFIAKNK